MRELQETSAELRPFHHEESGSRPPVQTPESLSPGISLSLDEMSATAGTSSAAVASARFSGGKSLATGAESPPQRCPDQDPSLVCDDEIMARLAHALREQQQRQASADADAKVGPAGRYTMLGCQAAALRLAKLGAGLVSRRREQSVR